MTVKPLYPRSFPQGSVLGLVLGLLLSACSFWTWSKLTDPLQASLIVPYLRCYYDADLPDRPHLRVQKGPRRINVAPAGQPPVEVFPLLASSVLSTQYFGGRTPYEVLFWPLWISGCVLTLCLVDGITEDVKYAVRVRRGVQIRGPILLTRAEFNRQVKGDGMGLYLKNRRTFLELLKGCNGFRIFVKKQHETQGRLVMGDTGTGKSSVLIQTMDQAQAQGRACIVYDPHLQFTPRYFNAERGDVILNPYDARCPYYNPLHELDLTNLDAAWSGALSQGESLFPDSVSGDKAKDWFFTKTSRKLWQHLLVNFQPEPWQMAEWMRNELKILERVVGTDLETMVPRTSSDQRAAVLSTFGMVADALEQLPRREETDHEWSIREWAKTRKGWIFLTNDMNSRASLKPFQSFVLDQCITQVASMSERPDLPKVDVVIDEAQTLQRLTKLLPLLTELRKFGMAPTVAFQGRSQMKEIYGDNAEVVFGMPIAKYFFRIADGDAAEWAEKMIGKIDLLQVKESRPGHPIANARSGSYTEQEVTKPLISASQLSALPDLSGYLRYGDEGRVVRIRVPNPKEYRQLFGEGRQAAAFLPRRSLAVVKQEVSPETARMIAKAMAQHESMAPQPAVEVQSPASAALEVKTFF